jgi:hypothetical protein
MISFTNVQVFDVERLLPPMTEQVTYDLCDVTVHSQPTGPTALGLSGAAATKRTRVGTAVVPEAHGMVPYGRFPGDAFPIISD